MFFCTLFNSKYLAKGILTIQSLLTVCPDAVIYVLALDEQTRLLLNDFDGQRVIIVSLSEFETEELLEIKQRRTVTEYCWTCGSVFCFYCITTFSLSHCIYIDADLFFFASPELLLRDSSQFDVMITSHRYSDGYDLSQTSGKYCVQFVYFKNTDNGMRVLSWWKDACLNWCYNRMEEGKFGDQKYLDDWPERFNGVYVMEHEGGGVAPWNIQQYQVKNCPELTIHNKRTGDSFPLVFYHFHHLNNYRLNSSNEFRIGPYPIPHEAFSLIYKPYIKKLISIYHTYATDCFDPLGSKKIELSSFHYLLHRVKTALIKQDKYPWPI